MSSKLAEWVESHVTADPNNPTAVRLVLPTLPEDARVLVCYAHAAEAQYRDNLLGSLRDWAQRMIEKAPKQGRLRVLHEYATDMESMTAFRSALPEIIAKLTQLAAAEAECECSRREIDAHRLYWQTEGNSAGVSEGARIETNAARARHDQAKKGTP